MLAALKALGDGVDRELANELQAAVEPIVARTRTLTPRGPGVIATAKHPSDKLPHLADTIYGTARGRFAEIVSSHPAGPVFEYGGDIRPRGGGARAGSFVQDAKGPRKASSQVISIPQVGMAHKAAATELPGLQRDLEARLDALARRVGL